MNLLTYNLDTVIVNIAHQAMLRYLIQ